MNKVLIKNISIVNENEIYKADIYIEDKYIAKIDESISPKPGCKLLNLDNYYVLPGVIDDQVHFREPGFPEKEDIESGSLAAVAGGITSFIEMPNTSPSTTSISRWKEKMKLGKEKSLANYGFMLGATNDNIDEIKKIDPLLVPGVKVFMGSSTGNLLVDNPKSLARIFAESPVIIAAHCEEESIIRENLEKARKQYGNNIPPHMHAIIRSEECCVMSTQKAIELAKTHKARLHVFHISTEKETYLFEDKKTPLEDKKITAEACIHHLWFDQKDYEKRGNLIKWNPSVKSHKEALWNALLNDRLDVIATDHAPHTLEEKQQSDYFKAPAGGPMVQHALSAMLHQAIEREIPFTTIVEKMCHNPAKIFNIKNRGFIREGYYADLAIIQKGVPWAVSKENVLYKCGWTPLSGHTLKSRVSHTFVNGNLVYKNGLLYKDHKGLALEFDR